MEAGALNLKLMADITDLVSKMDQAKNTVNGSMDSMEKAFGVAKNAFIGLVGIGSVGAFAGMVTSSIEATGKLHDLAIQTGASEAALGEFRKMGAYTETSADTIAQAMNKLGKNMALSTIDSKGAAVAIQALGIDFNTLKAMSPEDQMVLIAQSMNKFADGADKGAAAQALFGKEGAKLLPFGTTAAAFGAAFMAFAGAAREAAPSARDDEFHSVLMAHSAGARAAWVAGLIDGDA
jgi:hypothetical protein